MVTGHCGRDWSVAFCGKPNYRGVCRFPPLFKISTELTAVRHVGLHIAVGRIYDSLNPQSTPQSCHTLTLTMTRPQRLGGVETSASDTTISKRKRFDLSNTRGARFWYELNAQRDLRGRFSELFAPKRGIHNARPWLFRKLLWDTYGPDAQSMEYLQALTTAGPTEFRG